ncbi:protein phosphatase 1 regulatory inhibitor subunit 16B [Leucoraja erinacea]|uniref:protein phosphatase 1 regulatory inhibitor subunit 16B n=1 Tax=Leucoraja erinaceus TaxID=7782 RepID=UPI00245632DE|nr:protein phosphatase 1 regulatory inhibitor subunit 16B [Leucoraja erinacea]
MVLHLVMSSHTDLLTDLPFPERLPTPDRLRAAKRRRAQQLKKWAQYEKDMQNKKRKTDKKKSVGNHRRVTFTPSVTLLEASSRNDLHEVSHLLKKNINPDLSNEDGLTALHQSCIDNFEDMVKLLLEFGTHVDATDNELWTPLHAAATCRHSNLVKLLIERGADLLAVNADGNMPYDLCDDDQTLELIETAMVNQGITQEKIDQIRTAVEQQMIGDVKEAVQKGTDLNGRDAQGATLLHVVAANGYCTVAEILLEHGAKVNIKDRDGWEPLHAAASWGQMQIAELLTANGASLNAKTYLKETPIDLCEDEEFRTLLRQLKHKHENIQKSQGKNKSSLTRRTSSAGSRGTVVRRASVCDRNNLYRKECEQEAIIWQQMGRKEMEKDAASSDGEDKDSSKDQENVMPDQPKASQTSEVEQTESMEKSSDAGGGSNKLLDPGGRSNSAVSTPTSQRSASRPPTAADKVNGQVPHESCDVNPSPQLSGDRSCQTLSELKRQRAAAKPRKQLSQDAALPNGQSSFSESDRLPPKSCLVDSPRTSALSSNGSSVYHPHRSGDPPILRLKAPSEEPEVKRQGCCRIV